MNTDDAEKDAEELLQEASKQRRHTTEAPDPVPENVDREALEGFIEKAEAGEFGTDPDLKAAVRSVRFLLDQGS